MRSSRYEGVVASLIAAGLWEILKFLAGLVFTTSASISLSHVIARRSELLSAHPVLVSILFGAGGAWLFIAVFQRYTGRRPRFGPLDYEFSVLEKRIEMNYHSLERMSYRKEHTLKALKNNVDRYVDKYLWTGDNPPELHAVVPGQTVNETVRRNIWQHYEVLFGRHLQKGEEIAITVAWDLTDRHRKAVPFISNTVEEPTRLLVLKAKLLPEWNVREVTCEVTSNIGAQRPFETKVLPVGHDGVVEWQVTNPQLLHHYEMRWHLNGVET